MAKDVYEVQELLKQFNEYRAAKTPKLREARVIRSLYKGEFWTIFQKHLKDYTITPDWNYFEYVVQAFLNSVYSGSFIGTLTPVREEDQDAVDALNDFVSYSWNKWGMKNNYLHLGINGELYNVGALRVDWISDKGGVKIERVQFDEIYLDPGTTSYLDGDAIFIERSIHIDVLKRRPEFADRVEKWIKDNNHNYTDKTIAHTLASGDLQHTSTNKKVSLIEAFIRNEQGLIDQIFILDETTIILEKIDLPIKRFPIVVYTPQIPDSDPYGTPKLVKILNTVIALNLIDSMEATQPYRLLNRVRFVNVDGRINMRSFADYGATPGATFEVKGDPRGIVHYQDIPTIPDMTSLKQRLENSIFQITGVDPYYKGRATNSVQTTGATQAMQARVTMLTDNSRITMLEEVTEQLTRLIVEMYLAYSESDDVHSIPRVSTSGTNRVLDTSEINFNDEKFQGIKFNYNIAASTLLPMNQANLFESAKAMYEMQAQYGIEGSDRVVESEDLVRYSDFPQKHLWLQRITKQKQEDTASNLVADLTNFASIFTRLLSQGLSEEQAAQQAIQILIEEKNAVLDNPQIGQGFR